MVEAVTSIARFDILAKATCDGGTNDGTYHTLVNSKGDTGILELRFSSSLGDGALELDIKDPDGKLVSLELYKGKDDNLFPTYRVKDQDGLRRPIIPEHTKGMAVGSFLTEMEHGLEYLLKL